MELITTGISDGTKLHFNRISWVRYCKSLDTQVIDHVNINEGEIKVSEFFKRIARFQGTKEARDVLHNDDGHFQFSLTSEQYPFFPVKWFELVTKQGNVLSYDIAFNTSMISINGRCIELGLFPLVGNIHYPRYRELKLNKRAFKCIANFLLKER